MPLRNEVIVSGDRHLNFRNYSQAVERTISGDAIGPMIFIGKGIAAPLSFPFRSAIASSLPWSWESVDGFITIRA